MEKIIFFGLAIPILGFVIYLGGTAIMKGFKAKVDNRPVKPEEKEENEENETQVSSTSANDLSDEISKLNELHKSGVLTQEEFEKAKSKLLNN
ncbi:SHOCT domain-containing protein [Candidatus Pelagibacter bacterium]|nr:SHOCT domain-containing protein [Candidatus Pelagibacter bacterium]